MVERLRVDISLVGQHLLPDGGMVTFDNGVSHFFVTKWGQPDGLGERPIERFYRDLTEKEYEALRKAHPEWKLPKAITPQERGTGTGNTVGRVQGQSPSAAVPVQEANPEVHPETPAEASRWGSMSAGIHGVLDAAGFVPALGAVPDLANAFIYWLEGNSTEMWWSLAAAVPGPGDIGKGAHLLQKGLGVAEKKALKEVAKKELEHAAEKLRKKTQKEAEEKAAQKAGGKVETKGVCIILAGEIYAEAKVVADRFRKMFMDGLKLYKLTVNPDGSKGSPHPGSGTTWHGHQQQLAQHQKTLRISIAAYDKAKCKQPPINKAIRDLAYYPIPKKPGSIPGYPFTHIDQ